MPDIKLTLEDWQAEDGSSPANPIPTVISAHPQRITVSFADGRSISIEQEFGSIRVHGYLPTDSGVDEPLSMSISHTDFSITTDALADPFEHALNPERPI